MNLNKTYWEQRYKNQDTTWDAGQITTPIRNYIDQLTNKKIKILIPGAGNGHEFDYLKTKGFQDVTVVDYAQQPIQNLKAKHPEIDQKYWKQQDFFETNGSFDLIIEQTFFCAIDPKLRTQYVKKMHTLLTSKGKIAGLFFDFPLSENGPPFGGSLEEYKNLFELHFKIKTLERSYNSIQPRANKELFFIFEKNI